MREKATHSPCKPCKPCKPSPQNNMHVAFVRIKKYCFYQMLCHF